MFHTATYITRIQSTTIISMNSRISHTHRLMTTGQMCTPYIMIWDSAHSKRLAGIEIRRRIQLYKSRFESIGEGDSFQAPMYYELTFNYKNFSAYYQGAIPCKGLSIPMIYDSELSSAIGVRYKYKDWAFQLSCDNFLTNPESHYHSIENSIVRTQGTSI